MKMLHGFLQVLLLFSRCNLVSVSLSQVGNFRQRTVNEVIAEKNIQLVEKPLMSEKLNNRNKVTLLKSNIMLGSFLKFYHF